MSFQKKPDYNYDESNKRWRARFNPVGPLHKIKPLRMYEISLPDYRKVGCPAIETGGLSGEAEYDAIIKSFNRKYRTQMFFAMFVSVIAIFFLTPFPENILSSLYSHNLYILLAPEMIVKMILIYLLIPMYQKVKTPFSIDIHNTRLEERLKRVGTSEWRKGGIFFNTRRKQVSAAISRSLVRLFVGRGLIANYTILAAVIYPLAYWAFYFIGKLNW